MDLKEAKKRLKEIISQNKVGEDNFYPKTVINKIDLKAISTILQELDNLQKENDLAKKALIANSYEADEINTLLVKIQELQKENEEYSKQMDLDYVDENFVSKDKLIEAIDFAINATDSTDDYSIGLCNGMIYVKALLTDGNPDYKKCQNNEEEKTYEFGLIVGTKREREYWKNKIREKIKEIYEDKNSEYYDMFLEQRDIEKTISILKDLLKEE